MQKISVIVPVYNVEQYLKKSVNSIIKQTYTNLEIILVDDGSTDGSGAICEELANVDNRIKVIHKENGGLSSARNAGMKIATGELIGFLDSDDYIVSEFYESLYNLIKKYDADIAEARFYRIPSELMDYTEDILAEENNKIEIKETICNNIEALRILYGVEEEPYVQKVVVWNKLYKREIFKELVFPEGKLHEDEFTTHKILYNIKKMVSTNRFLHGYMQTKNSIMRKEISQKRIDDNLGASIEALKFFYNKNLQELESKIMMRYLQNCIELSGKIAKEKGDYKEEKLESIKIKYILFYENIDEVEKYVSTLLEKQVVDLLKTAYDSVIDGKELSVFWDNLSNLIK